MKSKSQTVLTVLFLEERSLSRSKWESNVYFLMFLKINQKQRKAIYVSN